VGKLFYMLSRYAARVNSRMVFRKVVDVGLLLGFTLYVSASLAADRIALVIGNQSYPDAPLENPVNDAIAVGRALGNMGYETTVVKEANRQGLEKALDEFSLAAEKSDFALFFYAGHAIQVDGKNYMIPVDAELETRRDINKLVALEEITTELSLANSLGVAIIDACRDNPFSQNLNKRIGRSIAGRGLARVKVRGGKLLVAYATEADAIAEDGLGKHSPYTSALLNHIQDPQTDVRLMFGRVHDEVVAKTNGRQSPNIYGSLGGREYILHSGSRSVQESDIQLVGERFSALKQSIIVKDRKEIKNLAEPSKQWNRYLDYLLDNFDSIDLQLTTPAVKTDENGTIIFSTMTIKELRSANGDISLPSKQLRSIQINSRKEGNNWSPINW